MKEEASPFSRTLHPSQLHSLTTAFLGHAHPKLKAGRQVEHGWMFCFILQRNEPIKTPCVHSFIYAEIVNHVVELSSKLLTCISLCTDTKNQVITPFIKKKEKRKEKTRERKCSYREIYFLTCMRQTMNKHQQTPASGQPGESLPNPKHVPFLLILSATK